jgi:hypothetical protein
MMNVVNISENIILLLGSIAVAAQRFFYGAKVTKGSWFAWLQSLGMKREGLGFVKMISKFFWPF